MWIINNTILLGDQNQTGANFDRFSDFRHSLDGLEEAFQLRGESVPASGNGRPVAV
jgi:hypothetical protein